MKIAITYVAKQRSSNDAKTLHVGMRRLHHIS